MCFINQNLVGVGLENIVVKGNVLFTNEEFLYEGSPIEALFDSLGKSLTGKGIREKQIEKHYCFMR